MTWPYHQYVCHILELPIHQPPLNKSSLWSRIVAKCLWQTCEHPGEGSTTFNNTSLGGQIRRQLHTCEHPEGLDEIPTNLLASCAWRVRPSQALRKAHKMALTTLKTAVHNFASRGCHELKTAPTWHQIYWRVPKIAPSQMALLGPQRGAQTNSSASTKKQALHSPRGGLDDAANMIERKRPRDAEGLIIAQATQRLSHPIAIPKRHKYA